MKTIAVLILSYLFFTSCVSSDLDEVDEFHSYDFEPQTVIVKTNASILTADIFDLINSYPFGVEVIINAFYVTDIDGDQLESILEELNTKSYIVRAPWKATGYLHYQTNQIHLFTRFFDIKNLNNQEDWLRTMEEYRLIENFVYDHSGFQIQFKVPKGQEKMWCRYFRNLDFVSWADLNYYVPIFPQ